MRQTKLSEQQKDILSLLAHYIPDSYGLKSMRFLLRAYYIESPLEKPKPTRSQSASFSRSIRRLEARGLIETKRYSRKEKFSYPQRIFIELTKEGSEQVK